MEWRVRVEFDVETDDDSPITAAFAAAEWLQDTANENRLSYLEYKVAAHRAIPVHGTGYVSVDLDQIEPEMTDLPTNPEGA